MLIEISTKTITHALTYMATSVAGVVSVFHVAGRLFGKFKFQMNAHDVIKENNELNIKQNAILDQIAEHIKEDQKVFEQLLKFTNELTVSNQLIVELLKVSLNTPH